MSSRSQSAQSLIVVRRRWYGTKAASHVFVVTVVAFIVCLMLGCRVSGTHAAQHQFNSSSSRNSHYASGAVDGELVTELATEADGKQAHGTTKRTPLTTATTPTTGSPLSMSRADAAAGVVAGHITAADTLWIRDVKDDDDDDGSIGAGTITRSSRMQENIKLAAKRKPTASQYVTHQAIMTLDDDAMDDSVPESAFKSPAVTTTVSAEFVATSTKPIKNQPRKRLANNHNHTATPSALSSPGAVATTTHTAVAVTEEPPLPLGVCQVYSGSTCEHYLRNQSVFVPPHLTIGLLEMRLKAAYGVIRESKDMNPNCRGYALPSLCYSILPICRTPEKTNHQYFANKANHEHIAKKTAAAAAAKQKKNSGGGSLAQNGSRRSMQLKVTSTTTTTTTTPTTITVPQETTQATEKPLLESTDLLNSITTASINPNAVASKPYIEDDDNDEDDNDDDDNEHDGSSDDSDIHDHQLRQPHRGQRQNRQRRSFDVTIDSRTKSVHNNHYQALHANSDDFIVPMPAGGGASMPAALGTGTGSSASAYGQKPFPPTRSTENLRRICRNECELLENELCQKEYAIAKRHPTIGQMLPLEDCYNLPDSVDCSKMGIAIDSDENEMCYWENGSGYRGTVAVSASGKPCLQWARLMMTIANYPELAGRNYCRNPGGSEAGPWCFVDNNLGSLEKSIELCAIPRCSDKMWLYVIVAFISLSSVIVTAVSVCCCQKYRKRASMSNIQNINLPNVDKNIYGNSRLNSPIEMTSLLHNNASNIPGMQPPSGRNNSALRVTQYTLGDVRFVEELGEGAFGKVYKGELSQVNGEKIFVAVKALKENASAKTQSDFKREIELISDLRHDNIVCILGVVLKEEPLCMLFEYMTQGDLHEFLIANSPNEGKSLTQLQFLQISMQICEGMEYLSGHHYVHRDLAARNCLVGGSLTVKISDFGLSRDIYSSDYYRVQSKSLLPVRWMPSESILYGKFTTESDVWSYGVVLWEIYSYGLQPYYGYSNQEVISMVRARQLLPCPEVCPSAVYTLMVECWHEQAVRRPSFPEIGHRLKIWYQAQKRNDQNESTSLCPSRKGSTFSVLSTNRAPPVPTSITPSTSTHQLSHHAGSGGGGSVSNSNTLGRDRSDQQQHHHHHHHHHAQQQQQQQQQQHQQQPHHHHNGKEPQRYGANHHSLDREKVRQQHSPSAISQQPHHSQNHHSHHHHHHQPQQQQQQPQHHANQQHHQYQPQPANPPPSHHHHRHHRSLDRESSVHSSKSTSSAGAGNGPNARYSNTASGPMMTTSMSKSRSSNNSLSNIAANATQLPPNSAADAEQQPVAAASPAHNRRSSQLDVSANGTNGIDENALPPHGAPQSRSNSRTGMHRPPVKHHSNHHHHHHHQHHSASSQAERNKKSSSGPDGPLDGNASSGNRKLSAAGSVSSMHSEASGLSVYSQQSMTMRNSGGGGSVHGAPSACSEAVTRSS